VVSAVFTASATGAPSVDTTKAETTADAKSETKADAPQPKAPKAPEAYQFTAPEGFVIDEALSAEFSPVLKELDLTQEQADKLVAFAPRLISQSVDAAVADTLKSIGFEGSKDWATTSKQDKEFGGDKLAESIGIAKQARDQFGTPELRKLLENSPLGNHPEVMRFFYRVGKAISPDGYVPAGKAAPATNTAQRLYTESKMNP
jgi:hypothetical protein